jgi:Clostripain family
MKKIIALNISLLFLSLGIANSTDINFNDLSLSDIISRTAKMGNIPPVSNNLKAADAEKSKLQKTKNAKDWTIMVFMNGKNNLANFAAKDLNEMETIGSLPNINVVVEVGKIAHSAPSYPSYPDYDNPYNPYDPYNPYGPGIQPHWPPMQPYMNREGDDLGNLNKSDTWTGMRRLLVQKDNDTNTVTSPTIETLSGDMGSWEHLAEFGLWAKNKFPAKNYMLIVWNHGDGWKSPGINIDFSKGISSDDETGNKISTVDLGKALRKMGGVNIYASDACLMQMAEVVYELKDWAPVIVGSEETEPADGWPYGKILTKLQSYSKLRYDWIAKAVTRNYGKDYDSKGKDVTQSAIKAQGLVYVKDMINDWVSLVPADEKDLIKEAMRVTTKFEGANSKDLLHFLKLISETTKSSEFKNKSIEIFNYVSEELIIDNVTIGDKYNNAYGLAIYMPTYSYNEKYSDLAWAKETNWDEFLKWVLAK